MTRTHAVSIHPQVRTIDGLPVRTATVRSARPRARLSPIGAVGRGLVAGVVGTLAMDVWLYAQYRREHGRQRFADWEFSSGVTDWEKAPAPAQVGRKTVEGLFEVKLPDDQAAAVNNITHWGYGISAAAVYGIVAGSMRRPPIRYGLIFGSAVWLSGYAVLPAMHLYKQIWEYDRNTLAKDLGAHLVYGAATAAAFAAMLPSSTDRKP